jgi:exopolyphosphatase/guanosine-5'-triphosphate,3'-diphosphate pyrophosphatase
LKKVAVVDIGSNTVKLFIYEVKKRKIRKVFSESVYLRLLKHVRNGRLSEEGIEELILTLKSFKRRIEEFKPDCTFAVGTFVLRSVENSSEVLRKVEGIFNVEVLSGEEEAYYSALGALLDVKLERGLLFDIGGGSLEVCEIVDREPKGCKSYPLGTLSFGDSVVNGVVRDERRIKWLVRHYVNPYDFELNESPFLVGVGGSVRALRKISKKRRIKRKALKGIVEKLLKMKPEEISKEYGINLSRAQTVTVAGLVALELMDIFKCKELIISKYGIREGLVYKRVVLDGEC